MSLYRIPKDQDAIQFFYYELSQDDEVAYGVTALNHPDSRLSRLNVIQEWRDIMLSAFNDFPESPTPCWRGHCDQFGIVMLYLVERAVEFRAGTLTDPWFRNIEYCADALFEDIVPMGSEDRIFYRAWLSLIGHPDFVQLPVLRSFGAGLSICNLHWLMCAAATRICERGSV